MGGPEVGVRASIRGAGDAGGAGHRGRGTGPAGLDAPADPEAFEVSEVALLRVEKGPIAGRSAMRGVRDRETLIRQVTESSGNWSIEKRQNYEAGR